MNGAEKRVLIVDDDADFADAIGAFLEANGFVVGKACSGDDGVKQAKSERPDLILMDIVMNERTEGFRAISEIRRDAALKQVPIFVISSFATQLQDLEIPEGGWHSHDAFLSKPVDMMHLLEKVRRWVGTAE